MTILSVLLAPLFAASFSGTAAGDADVLPIHDTSGTIHKALVLTGHPSRRVILFDPQQYDPAHRRKVERLEAFVFDEGTEIYLNVRGRAYTEAAAGEPYAVCVLAAILVHEMAHLEGKDERAALAEERRWIYAHLRAGHIPLDVAIQHLQNVWEERQ